MVTKREKVKRRVIKPVFLPQITMPGTSALRKIAETENLVLLEKFVQSGEKKRKPEELAAHMISRKRRVISKKNTSEFYLKLFQSLYGGRISRQNEAPLFSNEEVPVCSIPGFRPDLVISGKLRDTYVEVKASSLKQKPWFAHRQFLGYTTALLENEGSKVLTAIFRYGKGGVNLNLYKCKNDGGHKCDNRCLVETLANSTRSLLVIPHNLLTFLLMLCSPKDMNHSSSTGGRNENYKRPYGTWITILNEYCETPDKAIDEILKNAKSKKLGLLDLSKEDFYLGDLKVTRRDAPRVYCRNRKIGDAVLAAWKPFIITEYKTPYNAEWVKHLGENLEHFVENLFMKEDYDNLQELVEHSMDYDRERKAHQTESWTRIPEKPEDGIPI